VLETTELNDEIGTTKRHIKRTTEANIVTSNVQGIVTYSEELARIAYESNEFGAFNISGPNLTLTKIVAPIGGNIVFGEYKVSNQLLVQLDDEAPKLAKFFREKVKQGIEKNGASGFIQENFSYLNTEMELGTSMGNLVAPISDPEIWQLCGTTPRTPEVKVVGASARVVLGGFVWKDSSKKNCEVSAKYIKIVDRLSGKPLFMTFEINAKRGKQWASGSATREYVYSQTHTSKPPTQVSESLPPSPSLERCSATPREAPPVAYPKESLERGEEGTVLLTVVPSTSGRVQSVILEKSSGFPRLDEWATSDAHAWIFDPTACAGITMSISVKYQLPSGPSP